MELTVKRGIGSLKAFQPRYVEIPQRPEARKRGARLYTVTTKMVPDKHFAERIEEISLREICGGEIIVVCVSFNNTFNSLFVRFLRLSQ